MKNVRSTQVQGDSQTFLKMVSIMTQLDLSSEIFFFFEYLKKYQITCTINDLA